jgi:hypothetical protein
MILRLPETLSAAAEFPMSDFLLGLAFVLMVVAPAIMASILRFKTRDREG